MTASARIASEGIDPLALAAWRDIVGAPNVLTTAPALAAAGTATFPTRGTPAAIVRPATREEVGACLAVARRHRVPVQVASRGLNWGYGSRAPVAPGCVLLELRRMTRIDGYDPTLGTVRVQPGVTQAALAAFLALRGGRHWIDPTGSHPSASVLGNALERGFGHTPYADHARHIVSLEVVLTDGEVLHTGADRQRDSAVAGCAADGFGPTLTGLFVQSTLGVVTAMRLALMPAPEAFLACHGRIDRDDALPALIDALRELRLEGTLRGAVHVANRARVLGLVAPGGPGSGRGWPRLGAWTFTSGLWGAPEVVRAAAHRLRARLAPVADGLRIAGRRQRRRYRRLGAIAGRLGAQGLARRATLAAGALGLLEGRPTAAVVPAIYGPTGRRPGEPPDPDRDGVGLIWVSPVAPATGAHARAIADIVGRTVPGFGLAPAMTLTLLDPRTLHAVVGLHYDRRRPGADARALACHDVLLARLTAAGYLPYRVGLPAAGRLPPADDGHDRVLARVRAALDPGAVMAAGRYRSGA